MMRLLDNPLLGYRWRFGSAFTWANALLAILLAVAFWGLWMRVECVLWQWRIIQAVPEGLREAQRGALQSAPLPPFQATWGCLLQALAVIGLGGALCGTLVARHLRHRGWEFDPHDPELAVTPLSFRQRLAGGVDFPILKAIAANFVGWVTVLIPVPPALSKVSALGHTIPAGWPLALIPPVVVVACYSRHRTMLLRRHGRISRAGFLGETLMALAGLGAIVFGAWPSAGAPPYRFVVWWTVGCAILAASRLMNARRMTRLLEQAEAGGAAWSAAAPRGTSKL